MKFNDNITSEYGRFAEIVGTSPSPAKPMPIKSDYERGIFTRVFAKRYNQDTIIEVSPEKVGDINTSLYEIVYVTWRVSGPRYSSYSNNKIVNTGVAEQNNFEIEKILKEKNIDLKKILNNPLEYWQGY